MSSDASQAFAIDGVLEINQTCAVETGCFPGDTPGLPVTITGAAGRSHRLTGDLVVPDENTDGIQILANGGQGIVVGVGAVVSTSTASNNVRTGISGGLGSTISGNTAFENGEHGIEGSGGSLVEGNTSRGNTKRGLSLDGDTAYRGNVVTSNTEASVFGGIDMGGNACNGTPSCP